MFIPSTEILFIWLWREILEWESGNVATWNWKKPDCSFLGTSSARLQIAQKKVFDVHLLKENVFAD